MWVVSLLKTEVQEEEELVWENGDVTVRYVGVEVAVGFSSILFYQDIIAYNKFTLSRVRFCSLTSACSHVTITTSRYRTFPHPHILLGPFLGACGILRGDVMCA